MRLMHGRASAYNLGCRCALCRECNRVRMRDRRNHLKSLRVVVDGRKVSTVSIVVHGTVNGYGNWMCRCLPCTEAHAVNLKKQRDERKARRND